MAGREPKGGQTPFRERGDGLTTFRAAVLGAVQGPTELLPVSSSAHLRIVPWLAGWDLDETVASDDRKAFEVAVHCGAAAALLIGQRRLIIDAVDIETLLDAMERFVPLETPVWLQPGQQ